MQTKSIEDVCPFCNKQMNYIPKENNEGDTLFFCECCGRWFEGVEDKFSIVPGVVIE